MSDYCHLAGLRRHRHCSQTRNHFIITIPKCHGAIDHILDIKSPVIRECLKISDIPRCYHILHKRKKVFVDIYRKRFVNHIVGIDADIDAFASEWVKRERADIIIGVRLSKLVLKDCSRSIKAARLKARNKRNRRTARRFRRRKRVAQKPRLKERAVGDVRAGTAGV